MGKEEDQAQQLEDEIGVEGQPEEAIDQIDEEALEELEPEEGDSSNDFFSHDPVELDEDLDADEEALGEDVEEKDPGQEAGPEEGDEKIEAAEEDSQEEVALDEPDEKEPEGPSEQTKDQQEEGTIESSKTGAEAEKSTRDRKEKVSFFKRNAALIGVFIFGMSFVGAGFFLGSKMGKKNPEVSAQQETVKVSDPIVQKKLAPFFVLLEKNKESELMAKIDFVVSWTRICGIRYAESRHQVRSAVYNFLKDLLEKGIDPQKDKTLIEDGAAQVLGHALGVTAVKVLSMETEFI